MVNSGIDCGTVTGRAEATASLGIGTNPTSTDGLGATLSFGTELLAGFLTSEPSIVAAQVTCAFISAGVFASGSANTVPVASWCPASMMSGVVITKPAGMLPISTRIAPS